VEEHTAVTTRVHGRVAGAKLHRELPVPLAAQLLQHTVALGLGSAVWVGVRA
jgi:hypothetical protein